MTAFVLNSIRSLSQVTRPQAAFTLWLLRPLGLVLSFVAACIIWLGHYLEIICLPSLSTRAWVKRRVRILNRMHPTRALGFMITLVGLLMVWLAILFKVIVEPVPYIEVPQSVESKDDALRLTLEAQTQNPALDKPLPTIAELVKLHSNKWGAPAKQRGRARLPENALRAPAAQIQRTHLLGQASSASAEQKVTPAQGAQNPESPLSAQKIHQHTAQPQTPPAAAHITTAAENSPVKTPQPLLASNTPCGTIVGPAVPCRNNFDYAIAPVSNH